MDDRPEPLEALLGRDPVTRLAPALEAAWRRVAAAAGAPPALAHEVRWWTALDLAARGEWDALGPLADDGLGEPFSEREAVRLAFLHCLSGSLEEAEHVLAQAVQSGGDEALLARFAGWCAREGLAAAAAHFR